MSYIRAMRMIGLVLLAVLLAPGAALPQERSQADIQVQSVTVREGTGRTGDVGRQLMATVVVYSFHDDDAQSATVVILLPVGVRFLGASAGCSASVVSAPTQAIVTCRLGNLAVGATRTVQVTTTLPPSGVPKKFGAFVWSLSPDPNPVNNYGEGTAP